jgi:uncharacterized protein YprB with RNaseH-like and TPR domain
MPRPIDIYLDIETSWDRSITVIGMFSRLTGFVQLVAPRIGPRLLLDALPDNGVLHTFNGHCFDIPVIRQHLGVDLRSRFESRDLRYLCKAKGLTGGQKLIERQLGLERATEGVDGMEAMRLWNRWQGGCRDSLDLLLRYNRDDVMGMRVLKQAVANLAA